MRSIIQLTLKIAALFGAIVGGSLAATSEDKRLKAPLWGSAANWSPLGIPDSDDRAILETTGIRSPQGPIGQIVFPSSLSDVDFLTTLGTPPAQIIYGLDGIGIDHQGNYLSTLFNRITIQASQTWRVSNPAGGGFGMTVTGAGSFLDLGANTLIIDLVNSSNFATLRQIQGTGGLVMTGLGTLTLDHVGVSYTGTTVINSGTLALKGAGTIATSGAIVVDGQFDISGLTATGTSINRLSGEGTVVLGSKTLTLAIADGVFSGAIEGDGAVTLASGTQILSGANKFTGLTTVSSGATLQLGNAGASGSIVGDVLNDGTLAFNRSDTLIYGGAVAGSGNIRQLGTGLTDLMGDSSAFAGSTFVEGGTLAVNNKLCGSMNVLAQGRLQGTGTVCNTHNAGTVAPGNSIGTLTVSGNFEGKGGVLEIEAELGGDASSTDRLVVTGDTLGSTNVKVINVGGKGAPTIHGIKVIDVGGASAGIFTLLGEYVFHGEQAVIAGAYAYTLQKGGVTTPSDGDWYLRSELIENVPDEPPGPIYQPGVALYESYPQSLLQLMRMPTLRDRVGDRYASGGARAAPPSTSDDDMSYLGAPRRVYDETPVSRDSQRIWWGRVDASRTSIEPSVSTAGATYDADQVRLQTGFDALLYTDGSDRLMGGFTVQQGMSSAHIQSFWGDGKLRTDGIGIGGTLTWYGLNGVYVDGQAQVNWFDTDIRSSLAGAMKDGDDAVGYGVSIETGKRFAASGPWSVTPQAQLTYTRADFDFMDNFGASVASKDAASLLGRLGFALDYRMASTHVYGIANLYYDFIDGTSVDVGGVRFRSEPDQLWGGFGVGVSHSWGADKYAVFGEVSVNTGLDNFGDSTSVNGTAGFRVRW